MATPSMNFTTSTGGESDERPVKPCENTTSVRASSMMIYENGLLRRNDHRDKESGTSYVKKLSGKY